MERNFTPKEIGELSKSRALSDADLIKDGASYEVTESGKSVLTPSDSQIREIGDRHETAAKLLDRYKSKEFSQDYQQLEYSISSHRHEIAKTRSLLQNRDQLIDAYIAGALKDPDSDGSKKSIERLRAHFDKVENSNDPSGGLSEDFLSIRVARSAVEGIKELAAKYQINLGIFRFLEADKILKVISAPEDLLFIFNQAKQAKIYELEREEPTYY